MSGFRLACDSIPEHLCRWDCVLIPRSR